MVLRKGKSLRPLYFYALAGVVAGIVLVSGAVHVARTRSELVKIYQTNALTVADSVGRLVDQALALLEISGQSTNKATDTLALDDLLLEYLAGLATQSDRALVEEEVTKLDIGDPDVLLELIAPAEIKDLENPGEVELLQSLAASPETVAIGRISVGPEKGGHLVLAFQRQFGPGYILLRVMDERRPSLLKRLLLQDVLMLFRDRRDILDIILVDNKGQLLARLRDASEVEMVDLSRYPSGNTSTDLLTRQQGDQLTLELTRGLYFRGRRVAILRVSVSMVGMERILAESRKATVLLSIVMLLVGFLLVRLILWRQEATLRRVQQMEDEVRRGQELAALGEMAAGVAHEIRNPLNAISMGLQSLAIQIDKSGQLEEDSGGQLLQTLRREVGSINRIVSEFLVLSRPENLQLERLDPGELVDHIARLLQQAAVDQGVEVRLVKEGYGWFIEGDRDKLTQALLNVAVNSLEACDSGGVVTLHLSHQKERVHIEVIDTGPGVEPENQANLFRPHFTTKEKGLGLGLFLAKRIVQAHGGNLYLGGSSARGTRMVMTIPPVERSPKPY
jgi:signal transduction histidine kinase